MRKAGFDVIIAKYRGILVDAGVTPLQVDITRPLSRDQMLGHCLWVLEAKIRPVLSRIGGFEEALRLIGCIQGTVMACGLCTVAETREHASEAGLTTWDHILDEV